MIVAEDRDGDVLGGCPAERVVDGDVIGEGQRLAGADEVRLVVGQRKVPVDLAKDVSRGIFQRRRKRGKQGGV